MSLDAATIEAIAGELDQAEREARPVRQIALRWPQITIDDAYAIQRAWVALKCARGRRVVGRKIGLTSKAMQRAVNLDEPDYGVLFDDQCHEDGAALPRARFIVPMVEVELAFWLRADLTGTDVTVPQVLRATEFVQPALELIDARTQRIDPETGRNRPVLDTIADNAACAGVVLGGEPVAPEALDLRWCGAMLYRNAVIEETGLAAGVLHHPANGLVWLARRLARFGEGLEAGQVVLAGSFTRPLPVAAGDSVHADFGRLGSVGVCFTAEG